MDIKQNIEEISELLCEKSDYFKGLSDNDKIKYINLLQKYIHCFVIFINKKINLNEFEEYLLNQSKCEYKEVEYLDMDLYQLLCSSYFKYFYIRNDIYIEHLTNDEQMFLGSLNDESYIANIDKIVKFVEDSYKKVISDGSKTKKILGPSDHLKFSFSNDDIVIGFRYNRFYNNQNIDWNINDDYKLNELNNMFSILNARLLGLQDKIKILEYTDESIDRKERKGGKER